MSLEAFGELESSTELVGNAAALRERMREDGYLFLRGYLDVDDVLAAREEIVRRLEVAGALDPNYPAMEAVTRPGVRVPGFQDLTVGNAPLTELLYGRRMLEVYGTLLGGPVRHYDFTWFRAIPGGANGTFPHCDVVYMGRGTKNLYTSWTPTGDVPLELGGLMILEKSHLQAERLRNYLERDVDVYCTNRPDAAEIESGKKTWQDWDGRLSSDPVSLREKLGGRWLTTDYQAGDVLMFGMATVHASMDNLTNRFRLSSDSRYQLASEPVDERWVGEKPVGHGTAGKRGRVC
jgi:hypothetical protein